MNIIKNFILNNFFEFHATKQCEKIIIQLKFFKFFIFLLYLYLYYKSITLIKLGEVREDPIMTNIGLGLFTSFTISAFFLLFDILKKYCDLLRQRALFFDKITELVYYSIKGLNEIIFPEPENNKKKYKCSEYIHLHHRTFHECYKIFGKNPKLDKKLFENAANYYDGIKDYFELTFEIESKFNEISEKVLKYKDLKWIQNFYMNFIFLKKSLEETDIEKTLFYMSKYIDSMRLLINFIEELEIFELITYEFEVNNKYKCNSEKFDEIEPIFKSRNDFNRIREKNYEILKNEKIKEEKC